MKTAKKVLIWAAIASSILIWNPSFSQNKENVKNHAKKELLNINSKDLVHDTIVKMEFKDILKIYGKEKGMEIIRKHFLEEINMYRKNNGRPLLVLDKTLNEAAQKFAEYWSKYKQLWHEFDGKWVWEMWVDMKGYSSRWENVAYWGTNIAEVVSDRFNRSEPHKKTMLGLNTSQYSWDTIPYTSVGIGIDWLFIVVEFATR